MSRDDDDGPPPGARVSYPRLAFSLVLFAMGAWYALSGEARFDVGGGEFSNRRAIHVDAHGMDAVVIGLVFVGVGLVNLALGVRGRQRLWAFWAGAAVLGATMLYGVVKAAAAVISLFS